MTVTSGLCERLWPILLLVTMGVCSSCHSPTRSTTTAMASIQVTGQTPISVARALTEVFKEAGFSPVPVPSSREMKLMFDRPGNTGDTLLYGDWSMDKIWYRAKLRVDRVGTDTLLITCDAFRVLNHGDAHFEDEKKLSRMKHGAYQQLLDKAKARMVSQQE